MVTGVDTNSRAPSAVRVVVEMTASPGVQRLVLSLLAVLAVTADAQTPAANFYLARCSASGQLFDPEQWWRASEHWYAFPLSSGVMVLMCAVGSSRQWRPWLGATLMRMITMGATMPVSCTLAWTISSTVVVVKWQTAAFAALVLITSSVVDAFLCRYLRAC